MHKRIKLDISGLGVIIYSPFAVAHILENEDYLSRNYLEPGDVARHVNAGDLICFCTGSPGTYILECHDTEACPTAVHNAAFKLRLGIKVRDGVFFRDVHDLMQWSQGLPHEACISLADGWYRVTVYTSPPESGIIGDNQRIFIHFVSTIDKPSFSWEGVPNLC